MNQFNSSSLSPLPKQAIPCDLPYGLTWEDLQPILPGFSAQSIHKAQAFTSYDKQGLNGGINSCILTLSYPVGEQQNRAETVFIKHIEEPGKAEGEKYQFLAAHGVPVPRVLGVIRTGDMETLIIEFLPTIGIDFSSTDEVNSMLDLAARINAIQQDPPKLAKELPGPLPQEAFDELVRSALAAIVQAQVRTNAINMIDPARWLRAYQAAHTVTETVPLALNHNQFYFQQVGWAQRGTERQLVVFDLETLQLCPRFSDIAGILYPLSIYTGRDQFELFQIYLDHLSRRIPIDLSMDELLRELRYTRICYATESLPWLVGEAKHPDDLLGLPEISTLWDDISNLGLF